jgi:transposase
MLQEIEVIEIQLMYRQGKGLKQIARETGYSINTIRKYARDIEQAVYKPRPHTESKLSPYRDYLKTRIKQAEPLWIPATVLYLEIRNYGYSGSLSLLRDYLRQLKPKVVERPIIRFETAAGEQMQVDFAHFRFGEQKFYAFTAILGYSRKLYVEFVADQTVETVIRCHENAFDYYQGVPKCGLYDNMKSVIITRNAYGAGKHKLQDCFYDFAKHYGIIPRFCKPYNPQTKGKIERMISYLRYSFYTPFVAGKTEVGLALLNNAVMDWLNNIANKRVHATTKAIPMEMWHVEKKYLQAIPVNYTTNYGINNNQISTNQPNRHIMQQNQHSLQHELSVYDDLLCKGAAA